MPPPSLNHCDFVVKIFLNYFKIVLFIVWFILKIVVLLLLLFLLLETLFHIEKRIVSFFDLQLMFPKLLHINLSFLLC